MILVYIKNNQPLLVNTINYLAEKAADFNTVYSESPLHDIDAWVITNGQVSLPNMGKILFLGDASECPAGAIPLADITAVADYVDEDLIENSESLDLSSLAEFDNFDPMGDVYDLLTTLAPPLPEDTLDFTAEDLLRQSEEARNYKPYVELRKQESQNLIEEPEYTEIPEPEFIVLSKDDTYPEQYQNVQQEQYPDYPIEVKAYPEIIEPPARSQMQIPSRKPATDSNPPHIVTPPENNPMALQETGIGARTARRRNNIQQSIDRTTPAPLGRSGSMRVRRDNAIPRRIYVVTGTTPGCGVSSFCYSLASSISTQSYEKTLLIDMDVLKPNLGRKLTSLYDLEIDSDDTIDNFATMNIEDLLTEVEYLTSFITPSGGGRFSLIRGSALSFKNRKVLCNMDYTQTFDELSEVYQNIIIDIGVYNGMHMYQDNLINNHYCTIVLLDCSTLDTAKESIGIASQIGENYKAILSKCDTRVNPFKIQNSLHRPILGKILARTSAADIWRTGDPFSSIRDSQFKENWELLLDEVRRM